jgi:hypothetical protein
MREITVTVEITKSAQRTIQISDEQYDDLEHDTPESALGQDLFDELYDEADEQHNGIICDYAIVDDNGRTLFEFDR